MTAVRLSRQILFMANRFFLIVRAMLSGYNLKGYTVILINPRTFSGFLSRP